MWWVIVLLLAGCAAQPAAVPDHLRSCAGPVAPPPVPKRPVTLVDLGKHQVALQLAREATEGARQDCAAKLKDLNKWVAAEWAK